MSQTCACGKPTDAYVCGDCADRLGRALGDIPALEDELDLTLSRQRRFNTQTGGSRDAETPLAYNARASAAIGNLRALLVSWVKLCDEEHVRTRDTSGAYPQNTLTAMSRWLLWRVDGLALHPAGGEAVDELCDAVADCHRVVDRPPERIYAGPCECGTDLYGKPGAAAVKCQVCGKGYDMAERREWLLGHVEDRLATATEIARALTTLAMPVASDRIRQWKSRDRLTIKAHDREGRPMFRVGDVIDLLVQDTPKEESRRGA